MKTIHENTILPIKSWCETLEPNAMSQANNLANHPMVYQQVALMPDCHTGYGMPIGGVIGCLDSVIPNAVGVDIGCGMCAVRTNLKTCDFDLRRIRAVLNRVKDAVPMGEGHAHRRAQEWEGFGRYRDSLVRTPDWMTNRVWTLAERNLGTLGGGNHFIELQKSDDDEIWMMIHTGSRNLGNHVAQFYHRAAKVFCEEQGLFIPHVDLAYLPEPSRLGQDYIRDMGFALEYAMENRHRIMNAFKEALKAERPKVKFEQEVNIHHNYAAKETHFDRELWVHRKGATKASEGLMGIIPGSMGTPSYIVRGLGNSESLQSCSHGAGRVMGRGEASRSLDLEQVNRSMEGIVFDGWKKARRGKRYKAALDLGEAPAAYKNIESVIESQLDLIKPLVKLWPMGVLKG
jgi:tRNA-splicing ligase RtcB